MARSTDDLVRELSRNLPPVKPMRRIGEVVLAAIAISLPFYAFRLVSSGLNGRVTGADAPGAVFLLISAVVVSSAIGGSLAGLAGAIPGRESTARWGTALCLGSLSVLGVAFGYVSFFEPAAWLESATSAFGCATGAALLAIPAVAILVGYVVRGAASRVADALALAVAGGLGLAATVVHASCPHPVSLHLVLGHGLVPFAGGAIAYALASIYFGFRTRAGLGSR